MLDKILIDRAFSHAEKTADEILRRRAEMDSQDKQDKTLFIFMGEQHGSAWQHAIQILVMDILSNSRERLSFGMEFPKTLISTYFSEGLSGATISNPSYNKAFSDPDNQLQYKTLLISSAPCIALKAHHAHLRRIPLQLNDAAKIIVTEGDERIAALDPSDRLNRKFFEVAKGNWDDPKYFFVPNIIHTRNLIIEHNMKEHAVNTSARIYIQNIGRGHMAGYKFEGQNEFFWPYEQSIMGLFDQKGASDYLGIVFDSIDDPNEGSSLEKADMSRVLRFDKNAMEGMCGCTLNRDEESLQILKEILENSNVYDACETLERAIKDAERDVMDIIVLRAREIGRGRVVSNLPLFPV